MSSGKLIPDEERRAISQEIEAWLEECGGNKRVLADATGLTTEAIRKAMPANGGQVGPLVSRRVADARGGLEVLKRKHGIGAPVSEEETLALALHLLEIRGQRVPKAAVEEFRMTSYSGGPRTPQAIADELLAIAREHAKPAARVSNLTQAIAREQRRSTPPQKR